MRTQQSAMVSVLQQGLESVRAVKAFDRQDLEEIHLKDVSMSTVQASLKARKVKSLLSPVVALIVAACTAFVLWRGTHLVLIEAMTLGDWPCLYHISVNFLNPSRTLLK